VVPDQLVDRTRRRADTYFDSGAAHVSFADPYCPTLRSAVTGLPEVVDGGTMVVIEGPRFSTRAESQWFAAAGFTLINMTGYPEAVLARELEICYAAIALVTDLDAGIDVGGGVKVDDVISEFAKNIEPFKNLVRDAISRVDAEHACTECLSHTGSRFRSTSRDSSAGLRVTFALLVGGRAGRPAFAQGVDQFAIRPDQVDGVVGVQPRVTARVELDQAVGRRDGDDAGLTGHLEHAQPVELAAGGHLHSADHE